MTNEQVQARLKEMTLEELIGALHTEAVHQGSAKTFKEGIAHAETCGMIKKEIMERMGD